jgi:hypothetical protein
MPCRAERGCTRGRLERDADRVLRARTRTKILIMENSATLLAASVAALAAIVGYLLNQQANRRIRKTQFYAEALRAIADLEELPYRIRRRQDSTSLTRERIGREINDVFVQVSFYMCWLRIDAIRVGIAYQELARKAITYSEPQRAHAWASSPLSSDAAANLGEIYYAGAQAEKYRCEIIMRQELRFFSYHGWDLRTFINDRTINSQSRPDWRPPTLGA